MHWRHKWNDWAVTEEGDLVATCSNQFYGKWLSQERSCHVCGKVQMKITKTAVSLAAVRMQRRTRAPSLKKDGVA